MENGKRKIQLYKVRNFSEKFDDTFAFVRENYKVLLKYLTYLILPVCLVQAIAMNGYMEGTIGMSTHQSSDMEAMLQNIGWSYGGIILMSIIGGLLMTSVVYAVIELYNASENGLSGLTGSDFKPTFLHMLKRGVLSFLFFMALFILVIVLVGLIGWLVSWWIILPVVIGMMVVIIPLMHFMPVYMFEDISLTGALSKSLRLGFSTWWSTFAIIFVLGIIVSFVQGVFATPYYIAMMVKAFLGVQGSGDSLTDSVGYSFMLYLFGVIQTYVTYAVSTIVYVGLAYQYGHASEKLYHVTMEGSIQHFEDL